MSKKELPWRELYVYTYNILSVSNRIENNLLEPKKSKKLTDDNRMNNVQEKSFQSTFLRSDARNKSDNSFSLFHRPRRCNRYSVSVNSLDLFFNSSVVLCTQNVSIQCVEHFGSRMRSSLLLIHFYWRSVTRVRMGIRHETNRTFFSRFPPRVRPQGQRSISNNNTIRTFV